MQAVSSLRPPNRLLYFCASAKLLAITSGPTVDAEDGKAVMTVGTFRSTVPDAVTECETYDDFEVAPGAVVEASFDGEAEGPAATAEVVATTEDVAVAAEEEAAVEDPAATEEPAAIDEATLVEEAVLLVPLAPPVADVKKPAKLDRAEAAGADELVANEELDFVEELAVCTRDPDADPEAITDATLEEAVALLDRVSAVLDAPIAALEVKAMPEEVPDDEVWRLVKEPAIVLEVARAPLDAPWLVVSMRLKRRETELYEDVVGDATLDGIADDVAEGEAKRVLSIEDAAELLLVNNIDGEAAAVEAGIEDWLSVDDAGDDDDDTTTTATKDDED
ncbi:hypothetical protein PG984_001390 [Apiospora sp. TS-2023a]